MREYSHLEAAMAFEPTERYGELRAECPFHRVDDHDPPFYVLSRFDDIVDTLKQPDLWRNGDGPGVFYQEAGVLGTTDEPAHSRQRHVLRASFLPTAVQRLRPRVEALARELLDAFLPLGEGDFVTAFAAPFPALVIAELLGVPRDAREEFHRHADTAVAALTGGDVDRYHEAKAALEGHIERGLTVRDELISRTGLASSLDLVGGVLPDDVLSRLTVARADGTINTQEALHLGYQLLVAGHETTTSLLGMMLHRLLERPDVLARLRAEPSLLRPAIEEALRFDSPVHGLFRTNATETVVHGVDVPPRTKVQVLYASANRDPARFTDPDDFRIDRDAHELGRHVAFGWGIHHCIGAPLARLEAEVAFDMLLRRTASLELAAPPERNRSFVLHGLTHLPIRWTLEPGRT
jgi:cytochrome P450